MAAQLRTALRQKIVLGLVAELGIPSQPEGPAVAFEVRIGLKDAQVLVYSSDGKAEKWVPFGKFSLPIEENEKKLDVAICRPARGGCAQPPGSRAAWQGGPRQGEDAIFDAASIMRRL